MPVCQKNMVRRKPSIDISNRYIITKQICNAKCTVSQWLVERITWPGPHQNSCYVIYASNINIRQVALTCLCFQASLLSCHKFWPKTGQNHMAWPLYLMTKYEHGNFQMHLNFTSNCCFSRLYLMGTGKLQNHSYPLNKMNLDIPQMISQHGKFPGLVLQV